MPKRGSGKTRVEAAALDVLALCLKAKGEFTDLMIGLDKCISADIANDPDLTRALYLFKESEWLEGARRSTMHHTATHFLETALEKDFGDKTKDDLKGQLMPFLMSLSDIEKSLRETMGSVD